MTVVEFANSLAEINQAAVKYNPYVFLIWLVPILFIGPLSAVFAIFSNRLPALLAVGVAVMFVLLTFATTAVKKKRISSEKEPI